MATANPKDAAQAAQSAAEIARQAAEAAQQYADQAAALAAATAHSAGYAIDPFVFRFSIFILAVFVGYYVVWSVTPALHTPLMSVTNAISAIILVGAMLAAGPAVFDWGGWVGVLAVAMAAVNAFGGFLVTQRMLEMFKKKEPKTVAPEKKQAGS